MTHLWPWMTKSQPRYENQQSLLLMCSLFYFLSLQISLWPLFFFLIRVVFIFILTYIIFQLSSSPSYGFFHNKYRKRNLDASSLNFCSIQDIQDIVEGHTWLKDMPESRDRWTCMSSGTDCYAWVADDTAKAIQLNNWWEALKPKQ